MQERGVSEMLLYVDQSNSPAMHLYRKLGFAEFRADVQFVPKS
ncbi:MAG: hypothetical protein J2P17_36095 [Mycobacterium sp.]|nr:hypothetical protein [Mycobacterium sp.]